MLTHGETMDLEPATFIDARYRLDRLIGSGGMAEVWLAQDERLWRPVAVKILRHAPSSVDDDAIAASVEREALVLAKLQHPNIAAVYDSGRFEGRPYVVVEYVHGLSLREILAERDGRLPEAEAVRYGAQVADALHYAHSQGVLHCDIKPENVLVTEAGVAKAVDFGVAETVTRTLTPSEARELFGTVAYLAPEVIQGERADARSDIYSLALTVYELVAGRQPFSGPTPAATAGRRLGSPAPRLRSFAPSASDALEGVLARALALAPGERFRTAAEFAVALRRAAAPGRTSALPPAPAATRQRAGPLPPRTGENGSRAGLGLVLLGLGAAVAVIAGVGGALLLAGGDDDGEEPPPTQIVTATPTASTGARTATPTARPAVSPTPSRTSTASGTPALTATATPTGFPEPTPQPTVTPPGSSPTPTRTPSAGTPATTRTPTFSVSGTPSRTPAPGTPTVTSSPAAATATATATPSRTATATPP